MHLAYALLADLKQCMAVSLCSCMLFTDTRFTAQLSMMGFFSLSPFVDNSILPLKKAKTNYNRVQAKSF